MRIFTALILSFAVIYGVTLIPKGSHDVSEKRTMNYNGVNNDTVMALKAEVESLNNRVKSAPVQIQAKPTEIVNTELTGKEKFLENYNSTFEWLKVNKVLYRYQLSRSLEGVLKKLDSVSASEAPEFNTKVAAILTNHIEFAKTLKFSPQVITEFQKRLKNLMNPLEIKKTRSIIPSATPREVRESYNFANFNKLLNNIKEEKTVEYITHAKETTPNTLPMVLLYLAGLAVGVIGFASFKKEKVSDVADKSEVDAMSATMKRVLKELNYPVIICDTNFNVNWQNTEAEKLGLTGENVQALLSDSHAMENYELDSKSYTIKVEELKYKSGKISYVIQMVPQTISPRLLSNIVNSNEIEKVLERSLQESKDFKGLNQLVAENTVKMNYLFKVSAKVIDVDFDDNLSECFIESNRLNEAVKEFLMANYHLIKDDSKVSGLFVRTSEKGQRFNLSCYIPSINKESFSTGEASKIFIQKLSSLESKFNLYYPRVSFRWIATGETQGVDICLSLENKSELESLLKESNA